MGMFQAAPPTVKGGLQRRTIGEIRVKCTGKGLTRASVDYPLDADRESQWPGEGAGEIERMTSTEHHTAAW